MSSPSTRIRPPAPTSLPSPLSRPAGRRQQPVLPGGRGGQPIDTIFDVLVLVRWLHFTSMAVVFGGASFWLYMGPKRTLTGYPRSARATTRIIRGAAPVAALSGIGWLVASIANMTGGIAGVADMETLHAFFFETPFGPPGATRLLLLVILVALAAAPIKPGRRFAAIAANSGLLLISQAWLGHAAEGGDTFRGFLMIASYGIHVLAAAAWVGGLLPLLLTVVERSRRADATADTFLLLARFLARYSEMAVGAVGLILASGVANTGFRVDGAFGILGASRYGEVLFVKVGLVAIMLVLAACNRCVVMPRLESAPARATTALRASVGLECALGILVLGAAALLGVTPPPR